MRIMFTGGGTAGHVSPALAMAELIAKKYPDAEFVFVGRAGGAEGAAVERAGYPIYTLEVEGISRSLSLHNLSALAKAVRAVGVAKGIINRTSPDIVIGTGGYVCWPTLTAAARLGKPTLIHESNAYPGLVTRLLAPRCDGVMLGVGDAAEHLRKAKKLYTVGNPVRSLFSEINRSEARRRLGIPEGQLMILSFGGSLGAERLNSAVLGWMRQASEKRYPITHVHAAGRRYYDAIRAEAPELCDRRRGSRILSYIEDMPLWLAAADLAITRSGAMTLAELAAVGVPAILIPSPNVADDHQTKNARAAAERGAAILLPESELSKERLTELLSAIYRDRERLAQMKRAAKIPVSATEQSFMRVFEEHYPF